MIWVGRDKMARGPWVRDQARMGARGPAGGQDSQGTRMTDSMIITSGVVPKVSTSRVGSCVPPMPGECGCPTWPWGTRRTTSGPWHWATPGPGWPGPRCSCPRTPWPRSTVSTPRSQTRRTSSSTGRRWEKCVDHANLYSMSYLFNIFSSL